MLALAHVALGLVISATPVAVQSDHRTAQAAAEPQRPQKDAAKTAPPEKQEKKAPPRPNTGQESLRPPIGPRTTQGLAEDAISRGNR